MQPPEIIVSLVHIQGPLKGEIREFSQETIRIGRHPSNDVCFPGGLTVLSRYHAEIVREGNRFRLADKSANGTFVNGKRITESFLKDGDVIELSEGGPKLSFLTEMREARAIEADFTATIPPVPAKPPVSQSFRRESTATPSSKAAPQTPARGTFADPSPEERSHYDHPDRDGRSAQAEREGRSAQAEREGHMQPRGAGYTGQAGSIDEVVVETAMAPLVIQYGSTVRSFKQLPVTIGQHPRCGFVLQAPGILEQHAQFFFHQNLYWLKELTGQGLVRINRRPIDSPAALSVNDAIALTPRGPFFRFLGEGRLAEDMSEEPDGEQAQDNRRAPDASSAPLDNGRPTGGGIFSKVKKKLF